MENLSDMTIEKFQKLFTGFTKAYGTFEINKSNNDVFTDLTIMEHTNSKKRIGLTKVQNFSSRINNDSGLLETKGELLDKMRKMRSFTGDLHSFDVMLFWGSLRHNIDTRIKAFTK